MFVSYCAWSETLTTRDKSAIKSHILSNQQLTEELHKLIIGKFEKRQVHWSFKDNIWGADLADISLLLLTF